MLQLITWNIQSARSPAGAADVDGVLACLERFSRFDILCLQEVACRFKARDGSAGADQFAALAARLPGWHAARAYALDRLGPDGERQRLGAMVLSRHPIVAVLRHSLPWPADPAVPSMPRIALETVIDTPLGLLRVLNAHLEYFSDVQRLAQVDALRTLQREACAHARNGVHKGAHQGAIAAAGAAPDSPFAPLPRPAAAVLMGDFNMLPGARAYQALLAHAGGASPPWRDAWPLAHPGTPHAPTVGLHDPGGTACTFDYAFVGADLAPRVQGMRAGMLARGSDHQPLLLELA